MFPWRLGIHCHWMASKLAGAVAADVAESPLCWRVGLGVARVLRMRLHRLPVLSGTLADSLLLVLIEGLIDHLKLSAILKEMSRLKFACLLVSVCME